LVIQEVAVVSLAELTVPDPSAALATKDESGNAYSS
jgi:hypothetical protein